MIYGLAVHLDLLDTLRVDIGKEFLPHRLKQYYEAGYFDTAAGTAGTGAYEHQKHQDDLAAFRPLLEIGGGKAGGGDDGSHLKSSLSHGVEDASAGFQDINGNDRYGGKNDQQVASHFLHM